MKEATAPVHISKVEIPDIIKTVEKSAELTDEQLKLRRTGIGASEIGAIIGVNPKKGPLDVWLEKTGRPVPDWQETEASIWGRILEPIVASEYRKRNEGVDLEESTTLILDGHPRVLGTPDRIVTRGRQRERILQVKTTGLRMSHHWGEESDGAEGIPPSFFVQVQQEMLITGLPAAHVAVLIGGQQYRCYHIDADKEVQAMLIEEIERFWRDYVEADRQPPIDGSETARRYLEQQYPRNTGPMVKAPKEAHAIAMALRDARLRKANAELDEAEHANELKALIGENEGMFGDGWRVTWKKPKDSQKVDWEKLIRACIDNGLVSRGAIDSLVPQFTTIKPGTRRFCPTFKGEDEGE